LRAEEAVELQALAQASLLGRLFGDKDEPPPRGFYIHGEVAAQDQLMDLFFQQCAIEHKRAPISTKFMARCIERIYGYRQTSRAARSPMASGHADRARDLRSGVAIMFDEFTSPISPTP